MRKTRAFLSPAREDHGTSRYALAEFRSNADGWIYNDVRFIIYMLPRAPQNVFHYSDI